MTATQCDAIAMAGMRYNDFLLVQRLWTAGGSCGLEHLLGFGSSSLIAMKISLGNNPEVSVMWWVCPFTVGSALYVVGFVGLTL